MHVFTVGARWHGLVSVWVRCMPWGWRLNRWSSHFAGRCSCCVKSISVSANVVLSEFSGCARSLGGATLVNPWNTEEVDRMAVWDIIVEPIFLFILKRSLTNKNLCIRFERQYTLHYSTAMNLLTATSLSFDTFWILRPHIGVLFSWVNCKLLGHQLPLHNLNIRSIKGFQKRRIMRRRFSRSEHFYVSTEIYCIHEALDHFEPGGCTMPGTS